MSQKLLQWQFKLVTIHEEQQSKTNNIKIQSKIQKIEKKKSKESIQERMKREKEQKITNLKQNVAIMSQQQGRKLLNKQQQLLDLLVSSKNKSKFADEKEEQSTSYAEDEPIPDYIDTSVLANSNSNETEEQVVEAEEDDYK